MAQVKNNKTQIKLIHRQISFYLTKILNLIQLIIYNYNFKLLKKQNLKITKV